MSRQLFKFRALSGVSGLLQNSESLLRKGSKNVSVYNSAHVNVNPRRSGIHYCTNKFVKLGGTKTQDGWRSFPGVQLLCTSCGGGSGSFSSRFRGPADADYPAPIGIVSLARKQEDPYSQKLLAARTSEEILSVLETDADQMDPISLSVALDALFDALKAEPSLSTKSKHQLLTSVGMQKFCKQLRRRSPHMDPGDILNGVKLLSFLSAPGTHQTLQILLKLLSKHANLMDLQQLMYTQFLLDKLDVETKSPLSKALEYALPVVFESKVQTEMDFSDAQAICDYLHYASKCKLSEKTINLLVDAALNVADRLTPQAAKSVMWSLCDTKYDHPSHEPLVTTCYKKISESLQDWKMNDISTTISKAARKFSKRAPYYYNEDFMDVYCQRLTKPNVNPSDAVWSIKTVSLFRHINIEYLDHIGEIIASNPSIILNQDNLFAFFIKAISNFNYKPEKWSSFSSMLLEHPALTKTIGLYEASIANEFLALDMFPENLIRKLYSSDGLEILEEYQVKHHPIHLLMAYNAVKVLYPEYKGPLPPISMIENWKELVRASYANKQYPLKGALHAGLGGETYVINGLFHEGLHIDHGIVMRKGGYPVAVNSQSDSQSDCLSSITKPPESVIVLIKVFINELYANNTRRLRGMAALELKILQNLGHPVVAVDEQQWMELPDHEKIPFLMQKIRDKMEPLQWNQNWGDVIPP